MLYLPLGSHVQVLASPKHEGDKKRDVAGVGVIVGYEPPSAASRPDSRHIVDVGFDGIWNCDYEDLVVLP